MTQNGDEILGKSLAIDKNKLYSTKITRINIAFVGDHHTGKTVNLAAHTSNSFPDANHAYHVPRTFGTLYKL